MTRPDSRLCHYTIALYRTGSCTLHAASAVHHGLSGSTSVGSVCMADEGEYDVPRTTNSSPHTPSHGIAGKKPCVHKSIASQALRAHLHLYTSLTHCVLGSARSSESTSVGSVCMADEGEYDVPRTINSSPHTPSHGIAGKTPCVHKSIASQALRAHLHLYTSLTHCVQGSARSSGSTSVGSVYGGRGGIRCASHYQFISSYPITWHCGQEALPAQKHCEPSSACASSPVHFPERTAC